jgi:hypothetical protein
VLAREIRGVFTAIYVARVRIKVRADGETIIREGHGTGESRGGHPGEVHDMAIKTAETDATKRALATFGKPFGLSIYLQARSAPQAARSLPGQSAQPRSPVANNSTKTASSPVEPARHPAAGPPDHDRRRTLQRLGPNGRYYVPPRKEPTSDSFHTVLASQEAANRNGGENLLGPRDQKTRAPKRLPQMISVLHLPKTPHS